MSLLVPYAQAFIALVDFILLSSTVLNAIYLSKSSSTILNLSCDLDIIL